MLNAKTPYEETKVPPDAYVAEALDSLGYLKQEECPICAKHRDPETGELRFNAETIAAFEEGDAMLRGEIPATWYNSFEEMLVDLDN